MSQAASSQSDSSQHLQSQPSPIVASASKATSNQVSSREKELLERIELLERQLRSTSRMATIGELASTTTHEFNNLLMTVVNYARLGMRHKDEASRDKAFTRINDAANKATRVAGSVLALSRNKQAQHGPTSLAKVVENAHLLLEREFKKYRVTLELNCSETPDIQGDENELQRLLLNLLVNARQATDEGGCVTVALQFDASTAEAVLSVQDTGKGIPSDQLPKIFDPFFTTKSGPDASGKGGTGVGLSACKETIDNHAGRVRVESTVGRGTKFTIRFPIITETK